MTQVFARNGCLRSSHRVLRCKAADRKQSSASQATQGMITPKDAIKKFMYNSEDGLKQKATIEHVFPALQDSGADSRSDRGDTASSSSSSSRRRSTAAPPAPWEVGWQMSERNIVWNDQLKLMLVKRIASQELGVDEGELEARLGDLTNLLPDLAERLPLMAPKVLARMAGSTSTIACRLLELRVMLPEANVSKVVSGRLSLVLDEDLEEVGRAVGQLRALLPGINVDRFIEAFPVVLDVDDFARAIEDARRLLPGEVDVAATLRKDPDSILGMMKGRSLIPYDQIDNPWS